jgi:hypothetical protein
MKKISLLLLLFSFSFATTINVPADQSTIQAGIDAVSDGDTVLVSAGSYVENINFNGKNIVVQGEDRETTIIDGNQNGCVVIFDSGEDSTAIFSGFTITNGYASFGAGINLNNSNPILRDLIVMGNTVYQDNSCGGGINCYGASPLIENVIIMENSSNSNGGGFCSWTDSNPILSNVVIKYNNAESGGGVSCNNSFPVFQKVEISNNDATGRGGGLLAWGECYPALTNVTVTNNISNDRGGGLYIHANSESIVKNSILYSNSAPDGNQIFYYGLIDISYSNIQDGWEGEGNIDTDPLFVAPDSGDFHLRATSPCIDAGDPNLPLDPDSTLADMGAFYFDQSAVGFHEDLVILPNKFYLYQNHPNPFNPVTTLRYDLPEDAMVSITIYDLMGRSIKSLVNSNQSAGYRSIQWNATNNLGEPVSAGMYIYTIQAGEFRQTKKMVLLK